MMDAEAAGRPWHLCGVELDIVVCRRFCLGCDYTSATLLLVLGVTGWTLEASMCAGRWTYL